MKNVVIRHLRPERVWQQQYTDEVSCVSATNSLAIQNMWAANQNYSVSSANQERFNNLQMFDPQNLWYLLNSIHGNSANTLRQTARLYVTEYNVRAAITNIETAPIELVEYRCRARYDQAYTTSESATLGPPASSGAPTTSITIDGQDKILKQGFRSAEVNVNSGMGTMINYFDYGVTPFDNPQFVRQHKIIKVKKYNLAPGETRHIGYTYRGNRMITMPRIQPNSTSSNLALDVMKGTTFSVFAIRGTIAYNVNANAGYKIGVGNAAVGIIYTTKIRYTYESGDFESRSIINEIPGFANQAGYTPSIPIFRGLVNVNTASGSGIPPLPAASDDFSNND